ncbi:hypothetical protein [Facklamia sp. 7083-14-GEN3]|uniref:hypothetical protein n=1 Tax=Facklamia sp. 7083-14-GEN3 TaxID=2973478 RepID=UPI00215D418A|nr:hypothetical protein [Facklamia sp. 7083-14-GEN3]MCR8969383.1 hypothetical protein [Facklamia sp. 7083-14-GEN3]
MLTTIISSLMVVLPIMQFDPNYLWLFSILLTSTFFACSLGLLIASFYQTIIEAFGILYALMMVLILPTISYFLPSWSPTWLKWIPSYHMLEGFKLALLGSGSSQYIFTLSSAFIICGFLLFLLANIRYKKALVK